jgi:hypothetical protein
MPYTYAAITTKKCIIIFVRSKDSPMTGHVPVGWLLFHAHTCGSLPAVSQFRTERRVFKYSGCISECRLVSSRTQPAGYALVESHAQIKLANASCYTFCLSDLTSISRSNFPFVIQLVAKDAVIVLLLQCV